MAFITEGIMTGRIALSILIVVAALADAQVPPPPPPAAPPAPATQPEAPGPAPPAAPGLPPTGPSAPANATAPSAGQPANVNINLIPGAGQELPPEPADVPPAQPQSACNVTRAIVQYMSDLDVNATTPLFSRNAVMIASDSKGNYVTRVRGKRRLQSQLRAFLLFLAEFGPAKFTVVQTVVDQPDRCVSVGKMTSELLRDCPGAQNSSVYAIMDVTTQNGLVTSVNRTVDAAQDQLIDECIANKLNQTEQFH